MKSHTGKWVIIPSCIISLIALALLLLWSLLPKFAPMWTANNSPFIGPVVRALISTSKDQRPNTDNEEFIVFILKNKFPSDKVFEHVLPYLYSENITNKKHLLYAIDNSFHDKRFLDAYEYLLYSERASNVTEAVSALNHDQLPAEPWALGQKALIDQHDKWGDFKKGIISHIFLKIRVATEESPQFCRLSVDEIYSFRHSVNNYSLLEILMNINSEDSRTALRKIRNEINNGSIETENEYVTSLINDFLADYPPN